MWHKRGVSVPVAVVLAAVGDGGRVVAQCDPEETAKLTASDGATEDYFGGAVAIDGTIAVVGSTGDDDRGSRAGAAYVFVFDGQSWVESYKLTASDGGPNDQFGISVGISGTIAIVGAKDFFDADGTGSAYLFDVTTGKEIAQLLPDDGAESDDFGRSVAISGTTAIVGAPRDDDTAPDAGSAYLFDTNTGQQIVQLLADDGAEFDFLGGTVAISGALVVVGATGGGDGGNRSGAAYLFEATGEQIAKLVPSDGAEGDAFGFVGINGDIAIVGAPSDDDNGGFSGSAYLFDTTTGTQITKLLPIDGASNDRFGWSVAVIERLAVVGAWGDDDNGSASGSAYVFDVNTGQQIGKLVSGDGAPGDYFGTAVAISANKAIVGAHRDDDDGEVSGSAYVFDLNCPSGCPADIDGNGAVDFDDLLRILDAWGNDGGPEDLDGSGTVDFSDLLIVLDSWGPCA